jgi:hypothetical protein
MDTNIADRNPADPANQTTTRLRTALRFSEAFADAVPHADPHLRRTVAHLLADPKARPDAVLTIAAAIEQVARDLSSELSTDPVGFGLSADAASELADLRRLISFVELIVPARRLEVPEVPTGGRVAGGMARHA